MTYTMEHSKQNVGDLGDTHIFALTINPKVSFSQSLFLVDALLVAVKEWCTNQFGSMNRLFFMSNNPRWTVIRSSNRHEVLVFFTSDKDATLFKLGFAIPSA